MSRIRDAAKTVTVRTALDEVTPARQRPSRQLKTVQSAGNGLDASAAEAELMRAMQEYKVRSGRMFPTWSEVLEVLKGLGYEKPVT